MGIGDWGLGIGEVFFFLLQTKEWKLNNLTIWFVGDHLRAKAGKMPALLYEIFIPNYLGFLFGLIQFYNHWDLQQKLSQLNHVSWDRVRG